MPALLASAPAKAILCGEHAVVYSSPAIAVPITQVHTSVRIQPWIQAPSGAVWIEAPDIHLSASRSDLPPTHPLSVLLNLIESDLRRGPLPAFRMKITSTIPVASGLGSGAAVSVAVLRAVYAFVSRPLPQERLNELAYQVEKVHHGTPSGIDNTVITYARPVFFQRGHPLQFLRIAQPFTLVLANSGQPSRTADVVAEVRRAWQENPETYQDYFNQIASLVNRARAALETGDHPTLGQLLDHNHALLQQINVSSPILDTLVQAARQAGALGAKLSGAGRGGNLIALAQPECAPEIAAALTQAGAKNVFITTVEAVHE